MSDEQYLYYRKFNNTYNRWQRCNLNEINTLNIEEKDLYEFYNSELFTLVVYYKESWADEFYLNDAIIISFNEWYDFVEYLKNNPNAETEIYFGTNESQLITSNDFEYIETRAIFNEHAKIIKDYNMETNMVLLEAIERLQGNDY